jgi:hypothetical protein
MEGKDVVLGSTDMIERKVGNDKVLCARINRYLSGGRVSSDGAPIYIRTKFAVDESAIGEAHGQRALWKQIIRE